MSVTWSVDRSKSSEGPWEEVATGITTITNVIIPDQTFGEWWYFRVRKMVQGLRACLPSRIVKVAVLPTPSGVSASGGVGFNYIDVSWSGDALKFRVYRTHSGIDYWERRAIVNEDSFRDFMVSNDITYRYAVAAVTDDLEAETPLSDIGEAEVTPGGIFTMARSSVYQGIQIGPEVTPGTAVACTKRLKNIELMLSPDVPKKEVKYAGTKVATDTQRGKTYTPFRYNGAMDYNLMVYIIQSMFGSATPVLVGTDVYTRVWTPSPVKSITPKTFTLEQGTTAAGAEKVAYALFSGVVCKFSKDDASIEGTGFAADYARDITITTGGGGSALPQVQPAAVDMINLSVWWSIDGSVWTRLTDVLDGELRMSGMWEPVFHVNDLETSFDDIREVAPDFGFTATFDDGPELTEFWDRMNSVGEEDFIYFGLKATGQLIETVALTDYNELLKIYMPVHVMKHEFGDKQGLFGSTISFNAANDEAFGMSEFTSVSKIATL